MENSIENIHTDFRVKRVKGKEKEKKIIQYRLYEKVGSSA